MDTSMSSSDVDTPSSTDWVKSNRELFLRLLKLPRELRDQIYDNVLEPWSSDDLWDTPSPDGYWRVRRKRQGPNVRYLPKQIQSEIRSRRQKSIELLVNGLGASSSVVIDTPWVLKLKNLTIHIGERFMDNPQDSWVSRLIERMPNLKGVVLNTGLIRAQLPRSELEELEVAVQAWAKLKLVKQLYVYEHTDGTPRTRRRAFAWNQTAGRLEVV